MSKPFDLTGKRFGYLTAVCLSNNRKNNCRLWLCQCDCGNKIEVRVADLINGNTKSCGCYQKKRAKEVKEKHGGCHKRLYSIWCNMKTRCTNPNVICFKNYGGRGIKVCNEWANSYPTFEKWSIEHGYNDELTIERIDVNKDYCPDNCKFIRKEEQSKNTRRCHFVEYQGQVKTLTEWSEELHFGRGSFRKNRSRFSSDEETINYLIEKHKN